MKKVKNAQAILITLLLLSLSSFGQDKPKPEEKLTTTEIIAIQDVAQELNKANRDAANVIADIQKAHPGYTFDFRTGQFVKMPEPKKEDKKANP